MADHFLWRDPWGNPYKVYIKVTKDGMIELPDTKIDGSPDKKVIAEDVAV